MKQTLKIESFLILSVSLLSACAILPFATNLHFDTIEKEISAGTGKLYEAREPGLMVVSRPEEVELIDGLITDQAREKTLALDYGDYISLAAFQGWKGSSGYSILVNRISRTGNTVNVYAQFHEPKPEEQKLDMVTSPYHLVIVEKIGNWSEEILFNLIIDETIVASIYHTFP